jgi:hypothetical protein
LQGNFLGLLAFGLCMLAAPLRQVLLATKPALTPAKQQHPDDRWYTGVSGLAEFF